jgi:hypothetical protein
MVDEPQIQPPTNGDALDLELLLGAVREPAS